MRERFITVIEGETAPFPPWTDAIAQTAAGKPVVVLAATDRLGMPRPPEYETVGEIIRAIAEPVQPLRADVASAPRMRLVVEYEADLPWEGGKHSISVERTISEIRQARALAAPTTPRRSQV